MSEHVVGQVRYYALTDEQNQVSQLGRVVVRDGGLHGELLHEGAWVECRVVLECLFHNDLGEEVDLEEAGRLAAVFGVSLDGQGHTRAPNAVEGFRSTAEARRGSGTHGC